MAAVYDVKGGEERGVWATRYCRHVLHHGDGVTDLA
jgi:hypothetical protein